ncbi:MAG TPA: tyrosine-type recombinase/integrase [Polyangiaceae bacterium]|nr:tyrosine-type recombinase/integrase [Polyangiaceae bacterium]
MTPSFRQRERQGLAARSRCCRSTSSRSAYQHQPSSCHRLKLPKGRSERPNGRRARNAIQTDTPRSRRADFHSFRRAFNTALGAAGVNVQQAMALAGHKDTRTHMSYVDIAQRGPLETPLLALRCYYCP